MALKKMEILGFPGCVLKSSALAPGRSTSLCGTLQRWKMWWKGQQQIRFCFFLLCEWRLFWGSCCIASLPNSPSVLEPWGQMHSPSRREGVLLGCSWAGEEDE